MINIKAEALIAAYIVAMGEWNGVQWELFPNLPTPFVEHLDFNGSCGCYADFLRLTVNDMFGVHPLLYTAIVTHVFDMINFL